MGISPETVEEFCSVNVLFSPGGFNESTFREFMGLVNIPLTVQNNLIACLEDAGVEFR